MSKKSKKENEPFSKTMSRILHNIIHAITKAFITLVALSFLLLLLYVALLAKPRAERELFEDQVRLQMGANEKIIV